MITLGKCYSLDNEEFNYKSVGELIDNCTDRELMVGDAYWEGEFNVVTAEDAMDLNAVDSLLENMDQQVFDLVGENYDNECSDVSDEAKVELLALISAWAAKHIDLSRYWKIVGNTRECKFTAEDLA